MTGSDLCNSIKICWEIASDLVLHERNKKKKQTNHRGYCLYKEVYTSNEKVIIMIFVVFLIFIISISTYLHVYWEVVTLHDHTLFMIKFV